MGDALKSVFGGSKNSSAQQSTSSSGNQAYNYLTGALAPTVAAGTGALGAESDLLTNPDANSQAFQNYLGSTGYQFQVDQGLKGITNTAAVHGLLGSGATLKALDKYNSGAASGAYQNYLTNLNTLGSQGITAANTIAGAGNVSSSQSTGASSGTSSDSIFKQFFPGGL